MEKPNRAERRKNRFGGGRASEHGGWPTVQPNPVFKEETAADEAEPETPKPEAGADESARPKKAAESEAAAPD